MYIYNKYFPRFSPLTLPPKVMASALGRYGIIGLRVSAVVIQHRSQPDCLDSWSPKESQPRFYMGYLVPFFFKSPTSLNKWPVLIGLQKVRFCGSWQGKKVKQWKLAMRIGTISSCFEFPFMNGWPLVGNGGMKLYMVMMGTHSIILSDPWRPTLSHSQQVVLGAFCANVLMEFTDGFCSCWKKILGQDFLGVPVYESSGQNLPGSKFNCTGSLSVNKSWHP